jgi:hypothetical protein
VGAPIPLVGWLLIGAAVALLVVTNQWVFVAAILQIIRRKPRPAKPSEAQVLAAEIEAARKRLLGAEEK